MTINCGVDVARGLTGKNQPKREPAGGSSVRAPSEPVEATSVPGWSCGHCVPSAVVTVASDNRSVVPAAAGDKRSCPSTSAGISTELRLSEVPPPTVSLVPCANVVSSSVTDPALLSEIEPPPSVVEDAASIEKLESVTDRDLS